MGVLHSTQSRVRIGVVRTYPAAGRRGGTSPWELEDRCCPRGGMSARRIALVLAESLLALTLVYLVLLTAQCGIHWKIGASSIQSEEVIVPAMVAWLLIFLVVLLRDRSAVPALAEPVRGEAPTGRGEGGTMCLLAYAAGAVFVAWLAVHRSFSSPFVMDDYAMVNRALSMNWIDALMLPVESRWAAPGFLRPLPELCWFLEARLHGCSPYWAHWANFAVHAANVLLVGLVARRLLASVAMSAVSMGLFAVFGLHAEPLCWLASRYDLIATTFSLLCVLCFLMRMERTAWSLTLAGAATLLLALLSKESALALPFALGATALLFNSGRLLEQLRLIIPHIAVLGAVLVYRFVLLGGLGGYSSSPSVDWDKVITLPITLLAPFTWPLNTEALTELSPEVRTLVALGLLTVPLVALRRLSAPLDRRCLVSFVWLLFLGVPVYNSISIAHTLDQSRYLYLPCAGFCLFVGALLLALPRDRAVLIGAVLIASHFALLRVNTEPYVAAGATIRRALDQADPIVSQLREGRTVVVRGLPEDFRGAPVMRGYTFAAAVYLRYHVPTTHLLLDGAPGLPASAQDAPTFTWEPIRGFQRQTRPL